MQRRTLIVLSIFGTMFNALSVFAQSFHCLQSGYHMTFFDLVRSLKSFLRLIGFTCIPGVFCLLLVECSGSKESVSQHTQVPPTQAKYSDTLSPKPSDGTRITFGSRGGFTGGGGGFEIRSEGVINEYSYFLGQKSTILRSVEISPAVADSIFRAFRSVAMFSDSSNLSSNMTSSISYQSPDITRHWYWPMSDVRTAVTARFQEQYEVLQRYCMSALASKK